jgi:molybdopterin-guanine dinucleotide biosynthesis protein A
MGSDKTQFNHPACQQPMTMVEFSHKLLADTGLTDIVISGEDAGGLPDIYPNGGPLSGIFTAIEHYRPKAILALPVDMPLMTKELLNELKLKGELSQQAMIFQGSSLPIYLPVNALVIEHLKTAFTSQAYIENGRGPSFKQIFKLARGQQLNCQQPQALINTNTPEQWQQASAKFNGSFRK